MRTAFLLMLVGVLALAGSASAQEKAAVFEFAAVGIDEGTAAAATQIFRTELGATGKFTVVQKSDMESRLAEEGISDFACAAVACAGEYGYILACDKAVIGTLTQMGDRIIIEVSLVSVVRKDVEFGDTFTATSVDDLNMALRKLARAVADRKKIVSEVGRYAITEEETQEARRKKSYITSGAGFGVGFPLGEDSYLGISNLKHLVAVIRYEADKFVVESSFGISWGSGGEKDTLYDWGEDAWSTVDEKQVAIFPWDIGLRYIFSREKDFTPFIGGGVGLHFIASQDAAGVVYTESESAFAFHLAGGVYAFQSYDFHLTAELKYTAVLTDAFGADMSHQLGFLVTLSRKLEKTEKRGCSSGGCLF